MQQILREGGRVGRSERRAVGRGVGAESEERQRGHESRSGGSRIKGRRRVPEEGDPMSTAESRRGKGGRGGVQNEEQSG